MAHHDLKAHPDSFALLRYRQSQVQLRKNDRNYRKGDTITFWEYDPKRKFYTGHRTVSMTIDIVLRKHAGLTRGWCLVVVDIPTTNICKFDAAITGKKSL